MPDIIPAEGQNMIGTVHDIPHDYRRRKAHTTRAFLKAVGWRVLAHRHRRRALRQRLKGILIQ